MVTKEHLCIGGHTIQSTDDGPWNCVPETYIIS